MNSAVTVVEQYELDALGVRAALRARRRVGCRQMVRQRRVMAVVAHDPVSARGGLDMQFGRWASLRCHHSPPSWLGVPAHQLAPADGHEPLPAGLRAHAPLAMLTHLQITAEPLIRRLTGRIRRQSTTRRRRRVQRECRVRHEFLLLGIPHRPNAFAGPGGITRGGSASALPGQTAQADQATPGLRLLIGGQIDATTIGVGYKGPADTPSGRGPADAMSRPVSIGRRAGSISVPIAGNPTGRVAAKRPVKIARAMRAGPTPPRPRGRNAAAHERLA